MLWYAVEFIAYYCCTGVYTSKSYNKAAPTLSYAMKVFKYSETYSSDHLY